MAATPASWLLAVKARVDDETLIALTNSDSATQSPTPPVDDDRLEACICDARAEFAVRSGFDPKLDDPSHVGAVTLGTVAYLMSYKVNRVDEAERAMTRFIGKCLAIRDIFTSAPGSTNSGNNKLTPSQASEQGRIVRPDADRANFRRYLPNNLLGRRNRIFGL